MPVATAFIIMLLGTGGAGVLWNHSADKAAERLIARTDPVYAAQHGPGANAPPPAYDPVAQAALNAKLYAVPSACAVSNTATGCDAAAREQAQQ